MKMEKLTLRKVRKTDVVLIRRNGPETGQKNPYIVGATGGEPGWLALKYRTSYLVFSHSEIIHLSLCWGCFGLRFSAIFIVFLGFVSHFFPFQSGLPIFGPAKLLVF